MKTQPWAVAVGCFVAGSLAAAGIASATSVPTKIPDSTTGVITACMVKKTGAVRFINAQAGKTCTSKEKKITFNQTGPQGTQGVQGQQGVQGERGPSNAYVAVRSSVKEISQILMLPATNHVATLTLPAGSYVLSAHTTVRRTNLATDSITCQFTGPGPTTVASTPAVWQASGPAPGTEQPMALTGTYTHTADADVSLTCRPFDDGGLAGAGEALNGTLTATRVAEVTGP